MNNIITIGREFGSGGRELGRRLAEFLGYAYCDQEIVREIARRTQLSEEYVRALDERQPAFSFSFPIHIGRSFYTPSDPALEQGMAVYQEQARIITELAARSNCVIVGRCADYILRDSRPFRLFVYADLDSKLKRCRQKGPAEEALTDKELRQKIAAVDKQRARYYAFYTGHPWGDKLNFDLCLNTTQTDIKEIVPVLARLF